jgi:Tol biopolymer transport system component
MNDAGGEVAQLTQNATWETYSLNPDWSPNGKKIAFQSGFPREYPEDIVVINADGKGERTSLAVPSWIVPSNPTWSPDSTKIVCKNNEYGDHPEIDAYLGVYKADGSRFSNGSYYRLLLTNWYWDGADAPDWWKPER